MPSDIRASSRRATRPLLHIGYPKTASSWLQRNVFTSPDGPFVVISDQRSLNSLFVDTRPDEYDPDAVLRSFVGDLDAALQEGAVPVITNERLAGTPDSGGYDARAIADRLAATLPDARVVIVIREQRAIILSSYKEYLRTGGGLPLSRYLRPSRHDRLLMPQFRAEYFEYDRLIAHYIGSFGRGSVMVLAYELLREDPSTFVAEVVRFARTRPPPEVDPTPRRRSASMLALGLKRRIAPFILGDANPGSPLAREVDNRVLLRWLHLIDHVVPTRLREPWERRAASQVAAFAVGRFAESNARTAELLGIDLTQYGYEVARSPGASPTYARTHPQAVSGDP